MCPWLRRPPCSKALSAEHRPKFYSPSPVMVTSSYFTGNGDVSIFFSGT
jgi:hypothetical protein